MVTVEQVRRGVNAYLEAEIIPKLPGWKKWVASAAVMAYTNELDRIMAKLNEKDYINVLGLISEDGQLDVDRIYQYIRPAAQSCSAPVSIPAIGTITLTVQDVDRLYDCIMRA